MPESAVAADEPGLPDLLTLEQIEDNLFRSVAVSDEPAGLYGGQVAALALRAAANTVASERHPHSLHGYFLSRGDASRRVLLTVTGPEELTDSEIATRLRGVDIRVPEQPVADQQWPSRVWLRARHKLSDDTLQACALAYVSDMFSGLARVPGPAFTGPLTSIDHAVWIYRKVALDDWVLMDLAPESTAGGRGMYTGRIFSKDGTLAAGIAQESLFRPGPPRG